MTQKTINIVFGGTVAALLVVGLFAAGDITDQLQKRDKELNTAVVNANNYRLAGDAENMQAIDSVASIVGENQTAVKAAIKNAQLVSGQNTASIRDLQAAQADLLANLGAADQKNKADLLNALEMVGFALNAKIDGVEATAATNLANAVAKAEAALAEANGKINELNDAVTFLSADELEKLENKLARKLVAAEKRVAQNEFAIERANKNLEDKKARVAKALKRQKAQVGKPHATTGGWFFSGPKSQAKLDARQMKDVNRTMKKIAKIKAEKTVFDKRMANDKEDIAKIEAELDAIKGQIAKLTL